MSEDKEKQNSTGKGDPGKKPSAGTDRNGSADEKKSKKQDEPNTQTIPLIITLTAALISCIMSILQGVEFSLFVVRLLLSVLIFGAVGIAVRVVLDRYFFNPSKKEEDEEEKEESSSASDTSEETDAEEESEGEEEDSEEGES